METGKGSRTYAGNVWSSALKGDLADVQAAVEQERADVKERLDNGATLLHFAARGGHVQVLRFLLSRGADVNAKDESGRNAAHEAARFGKLEALKFLKQSGVDLRAKTDAGKDIVSIAKGQQVRNYLADATSRKTRGNAPGLGNRSESKAGQAPQGKKPLGRKKPFSGKAKKEYLTWKRERNRNRRLEDNDSASSAEPDVMQTPAVRNTQRFSMLNAATGSHRELQSRRDDPIGQESDVVLTDGSPMCERDVHLPRCKLHEVGWLEESISMEFPKRPNWQGVVSSADELHNLEEKSFEEWEEGLVCRFGKERLNSYERNLEYWRQLWRVIERSHVCLMIVDIRNPLLHFSHSLYSYVKQEMGREVVVLFNKRDVVPRSAVDAWEQYFRSLYPTVRIVAVQAAKGGERRTTRAILSAILDCEVKRASGVEKVRNAVGMGAQAIIDFRNEKNMYFQGKCGTKDEPKTKREAKFESRQVASEIVASDDSSSDWEVEVKGRKGKKKRAKRKNLGHLKGVPQPEASPKGGDNCVQPVDHGDDGALFGGSQEPNTGDEVEPKSHVKGDEEMWDASEEEGSSADPDHDDLDDLEALGAQEGDGPIVVCVIGEPNVGKSSTMNTLLGVKKVAVSAHPGRTKHFQTHYMTPKLMLCDCPGVVFPRLDVSFSLQVLFGGFPIAHCRDPYSVVLFLAERIRPDLARILRLKEASGSGREGSSSNAGEDWTVYDLCEAFAKRRNWRTRRGGRPDMFRSANFILRSALAGENGVRLAFWPPDELPEMFNASAPPSHSLEDE